MATQRSALLRVLYDNIPNAEKVIRAGAEVTGIERTEEGVKVHLADGTFEAGSIVIGADGAYGVTKTHIQEVMAETGTSTASPDNEVPTSATFYSIFGEGPNTTGIKAGIFYETRDTGRGSQMGTNGRMMRLVVYKKLPRPTARVRYTAEEMEEVAEACSDLMVAPGVTLGDIWPDINKTSARLVSQYEGFAGRWHTDRVVLAGDAAVVMSSVNALGVNCGLHSTAVLANELHDVVSSTGGTSPPSPEALEAAFARYQKIRERGLRRIWDFGRMRLRQLTWDSWRDWFMDRHLMRWVANGEADRQKFVYPMVRNGQILSYVPFEEVEAPMAWRWNPQASL